jgi:hypothetical protein
MDIDNLEGLYTNKKWHLRVQFEKGGMDDRFIY